MTEEEIKQVKQRLTTKIERTKVKIGRMEDMTQPIGPENAIGRVSRMDAINNKSVAEAALRTTKQKLSKLKIALSKIDKPEFGTCAFCKNDIPAARLMFLPESSRCVRCADR